MKIPYFHIDAFAGAGLLGNPGLHALQVSARGGELFCEHRGDRVSIAGRAVGYLEGTITI